MLCSRCGTDNERDFKFCVKCGSSLVDPNEINYEQVDMGGYHSEEEYSSQRTGFSIGSGTFTINDRQGASPDSMLYTSDELNDTNEEFDFSMYEDAAAEPNQEAAQMPPQPAVGAVPPPMGIPQMNPYMGAQPVMYPQPQIIGYDPNGMPVYAQAQPMMYPQPQIIGYDANGMPVYAPAQPMMYPQPQMIGYDANGMPVYAPAQPMMYPQPQIIGYDPMGMPVYAQAPPIMADPSGFGMAMQNPAVPPVQSAAVQPAEEELPVSEESPADSGDDFWAFFDGGKNTARRDQPEDNDFFSKSSRSQPEMMTPEEYNNFGMNIPKKKKPAEDPYMNDLPVVDSSRLSAMDTYKVRRDYMKDTDVVNADNLSANITRHTYNRMGTTEDVDAGMLSANIKMKSRYSMAGAGEADPDTLEEYIPKRSKAMMAQADRAVEAMPKKIDPYKSELDMIELPDYMKAKKTRREETIEIPSLPQVGIE